MMFAFEELLYFLASRHKPDKFYVFLSHSYYLSISSLDFSGHHDNVFIMRKIVMTLYEDELNVLIPVDRLMGHEKWARRYILLLGKISPMRHTTND